ncbi:MAG TPA: DUF5700 domain-containing putative Zn-dependent protease [Longimicrobium sp.]|nr:DUF5700 domain-containing putative Zn-dependent protease [Longimicrobium sp.]
MLRFANAAAVAALLLCTLAARPEGRAQRAAGAPGHTLRLDYAGAEALLNALEQDSVTDAQVNTLLRIHGVRAMVDNVTRFIPGVGVAEFRREVKDFARTKRGSAHNREFQLTGVWTQRAQIRQLIRAIRADEAGIVRRTLAQLGPYAPPTGPLAVEVYFVAGGVSDGFVFDDRSRPVFYANLARAMGDLSGVVGNMAHEDYHVLQKAAQRRTPGLTRIADSTETMPLAERLLTVTLAEGTANYVADPTKSNATGRNLDLFRARYQRNATPRRIAENFELFDTILRGLRNGSVTWQQADFQGFSGTNDARFYFVGYQMAKAIEQHCGTACIRRLFTRHPVEFFRQYIALYRRHPDIPGRFSPETEAFIASFR